ncbi:putative GABA permease [Decorospora gaudefroyi]|uniref:Putative GABA permease n=1 Tax=Decorospora gaudefroyi TaxID=184978 RepID=A0A6A5JY40_9PLEO|nr:putative GABA permease [Decorospora gaudefroyi]
MAAAILSDSKTRSPDEQNVFSKSTSEDVALEQLGYQQELKRSFGLFGMIGFSFSIVTSWSALSGILVIGAMSGGPPVMIWSWIGVCLLSLAVAYSMAEMCSAYPVAGGQYSWVALLAPPRWAKGLSYICGWFMLIGILAMGATSHQSTANFVLGIVALNNPGYVIERWHTVLVCYAIALFCLGINIFLNRILDKLGRALLIINLSSFVIVITTILAMKEDKKPASFVFSDFVNLTGFSSQAYVALLGLAQAGFGMCCYDAPAHMTEEIVDARKQAPRAIVSSVYIGFVTGLALLISASFCIGDIAETAGTPYGTPAIQIFLDSTSRAGASGLGALIVIIGTGASNGLVAEGGRSVFAFARDRGLPFSGTISKVGNKNHTPTAALCVAVASQMGLNSIYYGNSTGFITVITLATTGFYISYAFPLICRLVALPTSTGRTTIPGIWSLGRWSIPLNVIGAVYLVFASITFLFPTVSPVDSKNMNYTVAAIGGVMVIAAVTWVTTGRKQFAGPVQGAVVDMARGGLSSESEK